MLIKQEMLYPQSTQTEGNINVDLEGTVPERWSESEMIRQSPKPYCKKSGIINSGNQEHKRRTSEQLDI